MSVKTKQYYGQTPIKRDELIKYMEKKVSKKTNNNVNKESMLKYDLKHYFKNK